MIMLIVAAFVIGLACSTEEQRKAARQAQRKYNMPVILVTLAAVLVNVFRRKAG